MKYIYFLFIFFTAFLKKTEAQADALNPALHHIYLEAAGTGSYGSLNYERIIYSKSFISASIRAGVSTYHLKDFTGNFNPDLIFPLMITGCFGTDHHLEIGAGQTVTSLIKASYPDYSPSRETNLNTNFVVGYRYFKKNGGILFRISYTPIINYNKYYTHWGGISIGYSF